MKQREQWAKIAAACLDLENSIMDGSITLKKAIKQRRTISDAIDALVLNGEK